MNVSRIGTAIAHTFRRTATNPDAPRTSTRTHLPPALRVLAPLVLVAACLPLLTSSTEAAPGTIAYYGTLLATPPATLPVPLLLRVGGGTHWAAVTRTTIVVDKDQKPLSLSAMQAGDTILAAGVPFQRGDIGAAYVQDLSQGAAQISITDGASGVNPGATLKVGDKAPDFALPTLDGTQYRLSQFRGRPILLEFFAVWAPHCQAMASKLNQLDQDFKAQGLQTLAVLANPYGKDYESTGDTRLVGQADVNWFEINFKVMHPILIDRHWTTVNAYGANSYPTLYVVDKKGFIRYTSTGEHPNAEIAAAVIVASR